MDASLDPPGYRWKRITVMIFSSLQIAGCIVLAACSKFLADAYSWGDEQAHTIFLVVFIVAALLSLGIQLFGLLGALKHNVCLTTTYVVFQIIGSIFSFIGVFTVGTTYVGSTAWSIFITVIAFLLVRDMRTKRDNERRMQAVQCQVQPPYATQYA